MKHLPESARPMSGAESDYARLRRSGLRTRIRSVVFRRPDGTETDITDQLQSVEGFTFAERAEVPASRT